jgi:hypothetical protein
MKLPPLEVIANWPTPNYTHPVTRGNALLVVNYAFCSLAIITVALRLYTRALIKRWFGLDDIFIILALVRVRFGASNSDSNSEQIFTIGLTAVVLLANQKYGWVRLGYVHHNERNN